MNNLYLTLIIHKIAIISVINITKIMILRWNRKVFYYYTGAASSGPSIVKKLKLSTGQTKNTPIGVFLLGYDIVYVICGTKLALNVLFWL